MESCTSLLLSYSLLAISIVVSGTSLLAKSPGLEPKAPLTGAGIRSPKSMVLTPG